MELIKNGAAQIQKQIDEAENCVIISGKYEIEKTILIPSDFHLVLENCYLRMADNTFCNMFTNANCRNFGKNDKNVIIEGRGNVILDSGKFNGLSEETQCKDGRPAIYNNNLILFARVNGFKIKNLHLKNQRWWATNFIYCENGHIANLDFCSNPERIDENGNIAEGGFDFYENYESICVKNSDGIDIRCGCKNILVENITGFTEDDTVAMTSMINGKMEKLFGDPEKSPDMCNITVRNVMSASLCSQVRILAQGGGRIYNILVDGIMDTSKYRSELVRGVNGLKIGDKRLYDRTEANRDALFNITVCNIMSRAANAVKVIGPVGKNVKISNVNMFDGCGKLIEKEGDTELLEFNP